jgi:hypothetical protein
MEHEFDHVMIGYYEKPEINPEEAEAWEMDGY